MELWTLTSTCKEWSYGYSKKTGTVCRLLACGGRSSCGPRSVGCHRRRRDCATRRADRHHVSTARNRKKYVETGGAAIPSDDRWQGHGKIAFWHRSQLSAR